MAQKAAISIKGLTKRFGSVHAVENLSFDVREGSITGFLGRNGAGKTTTLRMIVGLSHPSHGEARVFGSPYKEIENPWLKVGTVLDADSFHPGRSGRDHLKWVAAALGLENTRVNEVLEETDIAYVADRRVKGYSLGMRQRLALATALLGDPKLLILDEPANGLDPQGMHWLRDLLVRRAKAGKTILLSSHVLAELAQFVDDIVVIEKGKLITQGSLASLSQTQGSVHLRAREAGKLAAALREMGATVDQSSETSLTVSKMSAAQVGETALKAGVVLESLHEENESLEDVFLRLTTQTKKG